MSVVYKIVSEPVWREAEARGAFLGVPVDEADGFIHLSSAAQAAETAARHFGWQANLVLVAIDAEALGPSLRWEPSRGGLLFPHLYGPLSLNAVRWTKALPLGAGGLHVFPDLEG